MKKYIVFFACLQAILWSCDSGQKTDKSVEHNYTAEPYEDNNHKHAESEDCDHEHDHEHETEHNHADDEERGHSCDTHGSAKEEQSHADEIVFTSEQTKSAGLETVTVKPGKFHQVIKTSGQILPAQGDEVTVSATANGIVSFNKASLNEGAAVKGGESLISISSKNLVDGDPIVKAKLAYDIAQREFQRAESLIADKLIPEKEYNEIKLNHENAKAAYQAIGLRSTARGVNIPAPVSGFVKSKLVAEGQYVDVGQPLMTVTRNQKLQLRADVPERYYKDLGSVNSANFRTSYDKTIHRLSDLNGKPVSYGRSINSREYSLPANFEFDNTGQFVSGSYVEVYLLGQPRENVMAIPLSSLTEEQGVYFVYLQTRPDAYKKQEVKTGANDGGFVEILSGLKKGDRVVSKGVYHVKLASTASAVPHAHEH
ncbi:MAG: efflux RND transporter periplasmic adaptor subunit [Prevotella sp.]|jgi:RND family efflux transporter MFP subunit|nr:efflux RND transporter periplasmic adaptor subunit [Prevotella sp.]